MTAPMSLPAFNATMNVLAALCLVGGYTAIRAGSKRVHRAFMLAACTASTLFLVGYLTHHARVGSVPFRGTGGLRVAYFVILISHTALAIVILPLVVVTLTRALRGRFAAHARLARITLPIWLYVSVTGVVVYVMLYHFGT